MADKFERGSQICLWLLVILTVVFTLATLKQEQHLNNMAKEVLARDAELSKRVDGLIAKLAELGG